MERWNVDGYGGKAMRQRFIQIFNRIDFDTQYNIQSRITCSRTFDRSEPSSELSVDFFSILVLVFVSFFFSAIISIIQFAEHKQNCECTASDGEPNAILNFQWAIRTCPFIHESISNIYSLIHFAFQLDFGNPFILFINFSLGWAKHVVSKQHHGNRLYILLSWKSVRLRPVEMDSAVLKSQLCYSFKSYTCWNSRSSKCIHVNIITLS